MWYLLLKHVLADFFFQTLYQLQNKGRYGHLGGINHAATHALFTIPVIFLLPQDMRLELGLVIVLGEFLIHYHVDWSKEAAGRMLDLDPRSAAHWRTFGLDQLAHLWTYVLIAAIIAHPQQSVAVLRMIATTVTAPFR